MSLKVAVTGAGGQTGGHVFRKMLAQPGLFSPVAFVRTAASREALMAATGAKPEQVVVADVSTEGAAPDMAGCESLVIVTSAKPKPVGFDPTTKRPIMSFPDGQPYTVDWLGQRRQIDAAKAAGVKRIVVCGSKGGTDPAHMLNSFGKAADGKSGGNILHWKRKAEKYLMDSGIDYTIVHPGHLLDEPGGQRVLQPGVDDKMPEGMNRSIPREDVAEVMVQSLLHDSFVNRSFDLVSDADSGAEVATDFAKLLEPLAGVNCDYSLGTIPDEEAEKVEAAAAAGSPP